MRYVAQAIFLPKAKRKRNIFPEAKYEAYNVLCKCHPALLLCNSFVRDCLVLCLMWQLMFIFLLKLRSDCHHHRCTAAKGFGTSGHGRRGNGSHSYWNLSERQMWELHNKPPGLVNSLTVQISEAHLTHLQC